MEALGKTFKTYNRDLTDSSQWKGIHEYPLDELPKKYSPRSCGYHYVERMVGEGIGSSIYRARSAVSHFQIHRGVLNNYIG